MTQPEIFDSVWDALEETPEEAAQMRACADLMSQLLTIVQEHEWTATEAAQRFHTTPQRMDALLLGRIDLFRFEELLGMVTAFGRKVRILVEAA